MNKVNWLVEQYLEAKRRYPNAKFSYIGHSHGTDLIAHALEKYEFINFERIIFAGSVVTKSFSWSGFTPDRVGYVLNYAATADWVVGIFPRIADFVKPMKYLLGPSLGGAGIDEFEEQNNRVQTVAYRIGQHSTAIKEPNWDNLAKFAVAEEPNFSFPISDPSKNEPKAYQDKRHFLYGPDLGWLTSIGGWLLVIAILLFAMPFLAFSFPIGFWLYPALIILVLALVFSGYEILENLRIESLSFLKVKPVMVSIAVVILVVGMFGLYLVHPQISHLNTIAIQFIRALSVFLYFIVLYIVLTRV